MDGALSTCLYHLITQSGPDLRWVSIRNQCCCHCIGVVANDSSNDAVWKPNPDWLQVLNPEPCCCEVTRLTIALCCPAALVIVAKQLFKSLSHLPLKPFSRRPFLCLNGQLLILVKLEGLAFRAGPSFVDSIAFA